MDEQTITRLEQMLQDTLELAEENNELLRKIQRQQRVAFWGKLLLWILVLGLPLLFLGPILHALFPYVPGQSQSVFGLPSADQVKALMNAYQASGTASY
jgi:hypothetical protein